MSEDKLRESLYQLVYAVLDKEINEPEDQRDEDLFEDCFQVLEALNRNDPNRLTPEEIENSWLKFISRIKTEIDSI